MRFYLELNKREKRRSERSYVVEYLDDPIYEEHPLCILYSIIKRYENIDADTFVTKYIELHPRTFIGVGVIKPSHIRKIPFDYKNEKMLQWEREFIESVSYVIDDSLPIQEFVGYEDSFTYNKDIDIYYEERICPMYDNQFYRDEYFDDEEDEEYEEDEMKSNFDRLRTLMSLDLDERNNYMSIMMLYPDEERVSTLKLAGYTNEMINIEINEGIKKKYPPGRVVLATYKSNICETFCCKKRTVSHFYKYASKNGKCHFCGAVRVCVNIEKTLLIDLKDHVPKKCIKCKEHTWSFLLDKDNERTYVHKDCCNYKVLDYIESETILYDENIIPYNYDIYESLSQKLI